MIEWRGMAIAGVLGALLGIAVGWMLWRPKPRTVEPYAREAVQQDGSRILERKPDPEVKPAQVIPDGAVVERVVQVVVQPTSPPVFLDRPGMLAGPAGAMPSISCPSVRVDLSLIRLKDQTRRVIASSPDGQVVGGVDVPVESARVPQVLRWSAGAVVGAGEAGRRSMGAYVERDVAFLRMGGAVLRTYHPEANRQAWEVHAKIGIRF